MADFTSGERRGLIGLLSVIALLVLFLGARELWWHSVGCGDSDPAAVVTAETKVVETDSLCIGALRSTDSIGRKGGGRTGKSRSKNKATRNNAPLPAPRRPLDQPVN